MMNRNLIAWATGISALLCASFAAAQRSRLDNLTDDYRLSRYDAAATIVLADSLHMSDRAIIDSARDCGHGVFEMAPAFVLANYANEGVDRVWRQRDGRKWLDYAYDLRVDMRAFNSLDVSEDNFDRLMWVNLLDGAYGCRPTLWDDLCGRGLAVRDALVTVVLGDGDPYYCDQIYDEYRTCHYDWAPVFVWCVGFELDFGFGRGFDRYGYGRDRGFGFDRRRDDRGRDGRNGISGRDRGGRNEPGLYDSRAWRSRRSSPGFGGRGSERTTGSDGGRYRGGGSGPGSDRNTGSEGSRYRGSGSGRSSDRSTAGEGGRSRGGGGRSSSGGGRSSGSGGGRR